MQADLTSIILTCYLQEPWQAHMTVACIKSIIAYTNPRDYELIIMSESEKFPIKKDKNMKIDRYEKTKGLSHNQSMNKGAELARGEYLCFIQNDVFVWREWLEDLKEYILRNLADCVMPAEINGYEEMQKKQFLEYEDAVSDIADDGIIYITSENFHKIGGFNERFSFFQLSDFYDRLNDNFLRTFTTSKVAISHIKATSNLNMLYKNPQQYDQMIRNDLNI